MSLVNIYRGLKHESDLELAFARYVNENYSRETMKLSYEKMDKIIGNSNIKSRSISIELLMIILLCLLVFFADTTFILKFFIPIGILYSIVESLPNIYFALLKREYNIIKIHNIVQNVYFGYTPYRLISNHHE
jgi:hypothetical protein